MGAPSLFLGAGLGAALAAAGYLVLQRRARRTLHNCKLTYFPVSSRGEAVRLALTLAEIPFEDCRISFSEWGPLKPKSPWGSLPFLELADGTLIGQSRSITRLVGKGTGLYPSDEVLAALVDECMDGADDIMSVTIRTGVGLPAAEKIEQRQAACKGPSGVAYVACARVEALYERTVQRFASPAPFLTGRLTIADLYVFSSTGHTVSGFMDGVTPALLEAFPRIQAVRKAVANLPKLVSYYEAQKSLPYYELNVGGTLVSAQYEKLLASSRAN